MSSSTSLIAIDPTPYGNRLELPKVPFGKEPKLEWIEVRKLRVDVSYQRIIHGRGARNIREIAMAFRWDRFGTVIVAPVQGGVYAIIDGQHRTTAAALRGFPKVPCQIVDADHAAQARAFAAINAQVTAITPMQLHAARLAAGDPVARELADACKRGGVTICRYPVPANAMKVGETLAAGQLARMMRLYGADVLVSAMRCITETRKGNAGLVRAPIIAALCAAFEAEPDWRSNEAKLLKAMWRFDFAEQFATAGRRSATEGGSITSALIEAICEHLGKSLAGRAA